MKTITLACLLAFATPGLLLAKDGDRHEVEALGLSFVLTQGLKAESGSGSRFAFQLGEPPDTRTIVIQQLSDAPDLEAYAAKRRAKHKRGPGLKLEETLRTVDGERAYSWVETRVARNTRIYTCVFVNPMTNKLTKIQLYTDLEERPGVRTIPPSPRDGQPSALDRAATLAYERIVESLDLTKRPRKKQPSDRK